MRGRALLACEDQLRMRAICGLCHSICSRSSWIAYSRVLGQSVVPRAYVWCFSAYSGERAADRQPSQDVGDFSLQSLGDVVDSFDGDRNIVAAPKQPRRILGKCSLQ
eukprot:IDg20722t1